MLLTQLGAMNLHIMSSSAGGQRAGLAKIRSASRKFSSSTALPSVAMRAASPLSPASSSQESTTAGKRELGASLRSDFPILHQEVNGRQLIYLDNAATSQKPLQVIQAMERYFTECNSNVHRGVHCLAARATTAYESSREKVGRFINAKSSREVVWTRNASEAINLVANTWGLKNLKEGDEVILSVAEHHSNLVPWQLVAQKTGAVLKFVGLTKDTQEIDLDDLRAQVSPRTRLISLVHVSNALGSILPAHDVAEIAQKAKAKLLLDCCQSAPHMKLDVQTLGADWIVGSAHKMCGPTGIGFLWGKYDLLAEMPPFLGGGEMIQDVFLDYSTYAEPPGRFEAGTPAIAEAIGIGAAVDYLESLGMDRVHDFEVEIGGYLWERMRSINGVTLYGPPPTVKLGRAALATFNVEGLHATDVSMILDQTGVAVRSGHHCAQPLHRYFNINASSRASLYIYNTKAEVDTFVDALKDSIKFFKELEM